MISEWLNGRLGGLRTGLWRHPDFVKLWAGETISVFGSLIGRTALHFTAILVLDARPFEVAALLALGIVPELIFAPFVGVWVDRLRRRPIMIAADLGRATLLASIPLAYAFDALTMEQLYVVAFLTGILSICFEVAYQSYLPSLIKREELLEGNSKLKASDSAADVGAFGAACGLYVIRVLDFQPGVLVMIYAARGVSSLFGAVFAARAASRLGIGPAMVSALAVIDASMLLVPLAQGAAILAAAFLVAQQLGDGGFVVYSINEVSLRQTITPDRLLGRVNAGFELCAHGV